jgi:hypothetical protein
MGANNSGEQVRRGISRAAGTVVGVLLGALGAHPLGTVPASRFIRARCPRLTGNVAEGVSVRAPDAAGPPGPAQIVVLHRRRDRSLSLSTAKLRSPLVAN